MSGGQEDAAREDRLVGAVEAAADDLVDALKATGDRAFFAVNPGAIATANEILKDIGLQLVKQGDSRVKFDEFLEGIIVSQREKLWLRARQGRGMTFEAAREVLDSLVVDMKRLWCKS